ncbi:hypothetical protein PRUPE_1G541700 [Prunus persica]|uniref:Uncharacterized protein n=1 Tax=Prunus persica TaxID=3760 RepID=A0A251RHU7_PRUPE|nr:hypothetical protein PRUPE_1G541700 [Prunus persica]
MHTRMHISFSNIVTIMTVCIICAKFSSMLAVLISETKLKQNHIKHICLFRQMAHFGYHCSLNSPSPPTPNLFCVQNSSFRAKR